MHAYSTDNDKRHVVYGFLGFAAYAVVLAVGWLTTAISEVIHVVAGLTISWGLGFTILTALFSRFVWKTRLARLSRASTVPDFDGKWKGYLKTSYDGGISDEDLHESNDPDVEMQRINATLRISQTWRKIGIHLETARSTSDSTGATILTEEGHWKSLNYQYENNPNTDSPSSMSRHYGTANLSLKTEVKEEDILEGFYYTGPDRENYGEMYFVKTEESSATAEKSH